MWKQLAKFVLKFRLIIIILVLSLTAWMGYFAKKAELSYEFSRALPKSDTIYKANESFKKMFIEKIDDVDINKEEPKYKFTNIQYSRCDNILELNKIISKERDFDIKYLETNYKLLINSLNFVLLRNIENSESLYI